MMVKLSGALFRRAAARRRPDGGPLRRLRIGLSVLGAVFVVAVAGYRLAGWGWLDSVYMVVTTLSTVGFREMGTMTAPLKLFTILVIVFGVSTALYVGGGFVQMVLEGEVNRALGVRRVSREIERLAGHIILCGFGRMGEIIAGELARQKRPFVILDKDPDRVAEAMEAGCLALAADATEEDGLCDANVAGADALVITLPSDADNVFITLTARNLNPRLQIVARAELRSTEKKLIQAGADRVVLPAATGALRMAAMVTRPSILELVELASGKFPEMAIEELILPPASRLVGATIGESHLRSRYGLLIVAIRHADGQLEFNPGAATAFQPGDQVIALGKIDDIERFRAEGGERGTSLNGT
jgi:voltage-gated potassium channel